ncbi:MAG: hypothetical protein IJG51_11760 [Synergistaceae bacterium]|nr:hypothetical protein [Synergistaceae bacterium]MBQ3759320.1 hypothetical protein [Synergistaceae bacterium]MBQ6665870.1 hypothetical protein [Synergistaceae bacterium]
MSVQYVKGSSPLGSLGTIAQIGGMAMGVPWVSALGMGMNAADGLINGYNTPGFQNSSNKYQDWILGGLTGSNIAENPDAKARKGKLS